MNKAFMLLALSALVACGADGAPTKPEVSATTKFGVNSESGSFSKTAITFFFGNKAD